MIEMTLSSRHRIRNSSPGGLRPRTLPLGHGGSWSSDIEFQIPDFRLWTSHLGLWKELELQTSDFGLQTSDTLRTSCDFGHQISHTRLRTDCGLQTSDFGF